MTNRPSTKRFKTQRPRAGVHASPQRLHVDKVGTIQVEPPIHAHGAVVTLGVHKSLKGLYVGDVGNIQVQSPMHAHGVVVMSRTTPNVGPSCRAT